MCLPAKIRSQPFLDTSGQQAQPNQKKPATATSSIRAVLLVAARPDRSLSVAFHSGSFSWDLEVEEEKKVLTHSCGSRNPSCIKLTIDNKKSFVILNCPDCLSLSAT